MLVGKEIGGNTKQQAKSFIKKDTNIGVHVIIIMELSENLLDSFYNAGGIF